MGYADLEIVLQCGRDSQVGYTSTEQLGSGQVCLSLECIALLLLLVLGVLVHPW